jgi:hypothetical protein
MKSMKLRFMRSTVHMLDLTFLDLIDIVHHIGPGFVLLVRQRF